MKHAKQNTFIKAVKRTSGRSEGNIVVHLVGASNTSGTLGVTQRGTLSWTPSGTMTQKPCCTLCGTLVRTLNGTLVSFRETLSETLYGTPSGTPVVIYLVGHCVLQTFFSML